MVVAHEAYEDSIWLQSSELCVSGRPVQAEEASRGAPVCTLPRGQELLLPENGSPDEDIRLADRVRPSLEQSAAQKGVRRMELLLESLLKGVTLPGPVIVRNLTGYVEELGVAAGLTVVHREIIFSSSFKISVLSTSAALIWGEWPARPLWTKVKTAVLFHHFPSGHDIVANNMYAFLPLCKRASAYQRECPYLLLLLPLLSALVSLSCQLICLV